MRACVHTLRERTLTQPDFDNITDQDLRDDDRLAALYLEAVRRKFWNNTPTAVLDFWSLAEKALQDDKMGTPGRLFYSLVKAKDMRLVADAMEQRAMARLGSGDRQTLVERAGSSNGLPAPTPDEVQNALFGRDIGYHHGVMMQCFMPQKRLPKGQTTFQSSHGRSSLVVRAGLLADVGKQHHFVQCGVPFGPKARIIMPYIVGFAVVRKTPVIDMGRSLRRFMETVRMPIGGRNGRAITEQVNNIAAADFMLGDWSEDRVSTKYRRVATEISFWMERKPSQLTFWNPEMVLSNEFFEAIQTRRVPVDMEHLIRLAGSPRRMDLYCWLSYRLPMVRAEKGTSVPLKYLQPIFAPDMDTENSTRLFKQRLQGDLKAIGKIYHGFNVNVQGDVLWLNKSPPPVSSKVTRLL